MKKNDIINNAKIESVTNLGFGVARHDGQVIFVSDTVMGDVADIKIIKIAPSYAVGRVEKFVLLSEKRTNERCSISACKSCAYKLISYEEELKIKKADVISDFAKAGLSEIEIEDVTPSPSVCHYRNKAQYPIAQDKNGEYVIGFYAPKSHRVTEARKCPLAPPIFAEILDTLAAFFKKYSISVYNEENGKGLLRHVYLRRGEVSGQILLTLVINGSSLPHSDELCEIIKSKFAMVSGLLLNVNVKNTNVVLGEKYILLFGEDYIKDTLSSVELKLSPAAFYQVNHDAAELLYAKAKELANPQKSDTLLDLYCGAGSIGLSMAREAKEVIGIEIVDSAVICARENAAAAGITNAHFYTGDAKNTERLLENAEAILGRKIQPDIVILDPPRAGCDEKLIDFVSSLSPEKIVYVSCNPATLARDAKQFKERGYFCGKLTPFDLFPATGHVESVVCLMRQSDVI